MLLSACDDGDEAAPQDGGRIVRNRSQNGQLEYLVQLHGDSERSREPRHNLPNSAELIAKYLELVRAQPAVPEPRLYTLSFPPSARRSTPIFFNSLHKKRIQRASPSNKSAAVADSQCAQRRRPRDC